jgi:hypothetical protein
MGVDNCEDTVAFMPLGRGGVDGMVTMIQATYVYVFGKTIA